MEKQGLIVIERPHQGRARVWSAPSRADFVNRVAASLNSSNAGYTSYDRTNQVVEQWGEDRADWPEDLRQWEVVGGAFPMAYTVSRAGVVAIINLNDYDGASPTGRLQAEFDFWRGELADDLSGLDVLESAEEYAEYAPHGHNTPALELVRVEAEWLGWIEEEEEEEETA